MSAPALAVGYGAKWHKAVAEIVDDLDVLTAFYDYPAEHLIHLRTTNPIESTFATVRLRQRVTKGPAAAPPAAKKPVGMSLSENLRGGFGSLTGLGCADGGARSADVGQVRSTMDRRVGSRVSGLLACRLARVPLHCL
jgi:hypothetical protein